MPQFTTDRKKLLNRIHRILGQAKAIEQAIAQEQECSTVLHSIAACRGAMDGLMATVIENHVRSHVIDQQAPPSSDGIKAVEVLIDVVKMYLK